ncbi:hypothetical protein HMN09_01082000 [Mycena chlorophos]|uniref:Uncharacterized protein n=1 Tax=Mycena chlorophos TaxID=658473 RepID=A0A8H6SF67_MYCCL|nr:hypothetical protein HMN09_01082000 [Mycena chlorophos]
MDSSLHHPFLPRAWRSRCCFTRPMDELEVRRPSLFLSLDVACKPIPRTRSIFHPSVLSQNLHRTPERCRSVWMISTERRIAWTEKGSRLGRGSRERRPTTPFDEPSAASRHHLVSATPIQLERPSVPPAKPPNALEPVPDCEGPSGHRQTIHDNPQPVSIHMSSVAPSLNDVDPAAGQPRDGPSEAHSTREPYWQAPQFRHPILNDALAHTTSDPLLYLPSRDPPRVRIIPSAILISMRSPSYHASPSSSPSIPACTQRTRFHE